MKHKLVIIGILVLAAALRFFQLGKTPPGLYWDEVSLGYNAYSILKTGKDEHGEFLPITRFKAFGDYKPPGYIYAIVPSIAVFGLNEFSVRFPAALAGVIMVWLTYLLVEELFPKKSSLAYLAALLLAISPWHLQLSRVAFEAMLAALFNLTAIYFFIKAAPKSSWWLALSAVFFILTLYTFNSNRLLTPILIAALTLIYIKSLWAKKSAVIVAAIIGLILSLPLWFYLRSPESKLRWQEVNIFSNLDVILTSNQRIATDGNTRLAKILHHRYLGHAANFLHHYFDHFNGKYLFISGDGNPRFSTQATGQLYLIEAPFLLAGLYFLITHRSKTSLVILTWYLLAHVPAATARETPHALRTLSALPAPQIIIAIGLLQSVKLIQKFVFKKLFATGYLLLAIVALGHFQYIYYRHFSSQFAGEWLTMYPPLFRYLKTVETDYKKIYVTPEFNRPYIYYLFYNQYDPDQFQKQANTTRTGDAFGFYQVHSLGKYFFSQPDLTLPEPSTLYVVKPMNIPSGFSHLQTITDFSNHPQFIVLEPL